MLTPDDAGRARHRLRFLLGLPILTDYALWRRARQLGATALISANAFSRWTTYTTGLRQWIGFEGRNLRLVHEHPVCLDSGGFVAARSPRGRRDRLERCESTGRLRRGLHGRLILIVSSG